MEKPFHFSDFKESIKILFSNPLLFIPSVLIMILFYLASPYVYKLNSLLTTNTQLYISTIFFSIIYLSIISFLLTFLISASKQYILNKNTKFAVRESFKISFKFWYKNLFFIILILIVFNTIRLIAHYLAFFIGLAFNLSLNPATLLFFLFYFSGLIGILIFFSLSNFQCIIREMSLRKSLSESFRVVKINYISLLVIFVLSFTVSQLFQLISVGLAELFGGIILTPILSIILSKMVIDNKNDI